MIGPTFTFGDSGCPAAVTSRAGRIRDAARGRYGLARTDSERLAVAVDYLRAIAAEAGRCGVDAGPVVTEAARAVISGGDAVADELGGRGRLR